MCGWPGARNATQSASSVTDTVPTWPRCRDSSLVSGCHAVRSKPERGPSEFGMDHMSDWMLPGAALALVVIVGIVIVALDDIVIAVLRSWRSTEPKPFDPLITEDKARNTRRGRLRRHAKRLLQRRRAFTDLDDDRAA